MIAMNVRLYNVFRAKFHLSELDAQEVVTEIEDTIKEQHAIKHNYIVEIINKDISSLREHMDAKFAAIDGKFDNISTNYATKKDLAEQKTDIIRWVFAFFVTLALMILGLYIKK